MSTLDENEFDDIHQDDIDEDVIEDPDVINDTELNDIPDDDLDDDDLDELNQDDQDDQDGDIEEDQGQGQDIDQDIDQDIEDYGQGQDIEDYGIGAEDGKFDNPPILIDTNKYTSDNRLLHKSKEELIREINKKLKKDFYTSSLKKNTVLEESNKPSSIIIVAPQDRITSDLLKKEETSYILSVRATHIARYSYPESMTNIVKNETDCRTIAKLELLNKRTPLLLIRKVGDNRYEIWNIREELKINSLFLNI